ncbi:hypothetical protein LX15_003867, partial [Streptoalloteichus tenebrarius]
EGRLVAGRYRLLQRLGSGAMGVVWQAHDERLHRTVAVKELLLQPGLSREEADEAKQRAMREGRIAARLQHPNAVTVFDVVEEDGAPCLVMEYLASRSLAAVMAERGTLPPAEAARIGAQVAAALSAAHAAGIVHRDIKPGNILLAEDGTVKITDFGISRATGDVTVTKTGMLAGTPAYLAPEVARGRDIGPPSDVFSLGSTLYAAVEGEPPFGLNENTLALLHAVAAGKVNPPSQAGPLTALLMRLLRSEPDERPTMAQAREALAAVAAGKPLPAGLGETVAVVPPWQSGGVTQAVATKAVAAPAAPPRPHTPPHRPVPPSVTRVDSHPPVANAPKPTRVAEIAPVPATNGRPHSPAHQDPPPQRPAAAPRPSAPAPKPRRSGLVYLAVLLVAAVAGVLIATSLIKSSGNNNSSADPGNTGTKGNHATTAPASPPPSATKAPKVNPGPASSKEQAVLDFYAAVPNADLMRSKLSLRGKAAFEQTGEFNLWASAKKAEIIEGPSIEPDGRYSVLVRVTKRDDSTENRRMYHPVIANPDGPGYLVDNYRYQGSS